MRRYCIGTDRRCSRPYDGLVAASRAAEVLAADEASTATERANAWLRAGAPARAERYIDAAVNDLRRRDSPLAAGHLLGALRTLDQSLATPSRRLDEANRGLGQVRTNADRAGSRAVRFERRTISKRARLLVGGERLKARNQAAPPSRRADSMRRGDGDTAAEFHDQLAHIDIRAGRYASAATRCDRVSRAKQPVVRSRLGRLGLARSYPGDQDEAARRLEEALASYMMIDAPRDEARALAFLAIVRSRRGEIDAARGLYERTLERARNAGDVRAMASGRSNLGALLDQTGRSRAPSSTSEPRAPRCAADARLRTRSDNQHCRRSHTTTRFT